MKDLKEKWTGVIKRPLRVYANPKITDDIYLHFSTLLESVKKYSPKIKGKVLDLGAGSSPYKHLFKCGQYLTLDNYEYSEKKPDIVADASDIPLENNSIDSVVCFQLLEHIKDPKKVVDEIYRILKPNGRCILTTHMATVLHGEPYDYFRFTKYGLKDVLFKKFKKVEIEENGGALLAIAQLTLWAINYKLPKFISKPLTTIINPIAKKLDKLFYSNVITINYL